MIDEKMLKEGEDLVNNFMDNAKSLTDGEDLVTNIVEHTGKKGMKWGVRRGSKEPMKTSSEHKKVSELKRKKTPQLTNKQIKTANERMNLEQNFRRLNPDAKARGQMKVKAVLAGLGTAIGLYNTINSKAGQASIAAGKKVIAQQTAKMAAKKAAKIALKNAPKQLVLF